MDVPPPLAVLGERGLHVNPEGTVSEIEIVPVNPFTAVSVIVNVEDDPGVTLVGEVACIRRF